MGGCFWRATRICTCIFQNLLRQFVSFFATCMRGIPNFASGPCSSTGLHVRLRAIALDHSDAPGMPYLTYFVPRSLLQESCLCALMCAHDVYICLQVCVAAHIATYVDVYVCACVYICTCICICICWGVPQTGFGVRSKLRKRRACTPGHRVSSHVFESLTKLSFHVFWGLTRLSFHTFWGLTRLSFHVVLGLDKALFPRVLGLDKALFPRVLGLDKALFPRILGLDKALFPHGFGA